MKSTIQDVNYIRLIADIFRLAYKYKNDMQINKICDLSPIEFYNYSKNIPFVTDGKDIFGKDLEILHRPRFIILNENISCDCDDKTLLNCSYFEYNSIPYGIGISGKSEFSHIFPIAKLHKDNQYITFDTTYPKNQIDTLYPKEFLKLKVFTK